MNGRALLVALAAGVAIGCAQEVRRVPPPSAFAAPMNDVVADYPDVAPLFPEVAGAGRVGTVRASALVETWGPPIEKKLSGWSFWPGNWLFGRQAVWTWKLGGRRVECGVEQPLYRGFEPTAGDCRVLDGT